MKRVFVLIPIFIFFSSIYAETQLSSHKNIFPFKYKPTPELEITVTKKNNSIQVIYPNGKIQEIIRLDSNILINYENITKDLNFNGYIDLGIWVGVNSQGLNDSYEIFLWDSLKHKLKKSGGIINPSIELGFLVDNTFVPYIMCPNNEAGCTYKTRYLWKDNHLFAHSTLIPRKDHQIELSFYKEQKVVKTVTVPYDQVNKETKLWNSAK